MKSFSHYTYIVYTDMNKITPASKYIKKNSLLLKRLLLSLNVQLSSVNIEDCSIYRVSSKWTWKGLLSVNWFERWIDETCSCWETWVRSNQFMPCTFLSCRFPSRLKRTYRHLLLTALSDSPLRRLSWTTLLEHMRITSDTLTILSSMQTVYSATWCVLYLIWFDGQ